MGPASAGPIFLGECSWRLEDSTIVQTVNTRGMSDAALRGRRWYRRGHRLLCFDDGQRYQPWNIARYTLSDPSALRGRRHARRYVLLPRRCFSVVQYDLGNDEKRHDWQSDYVQELTF